MKYGPEGIDPFSKVYDALWKLVESNPNLQQYLLSGNKTKYETDSLPKKNTADADFPELGLLNGPISNFTGSSSSRQITKSYIWSLTTGDLTHPLYNAISFELFRSMIDHECILCALTWETCNFVTNCRVISEDVGTLMQDLNRGIEGWASLLTIEVDFSFPTAKLRIQPVV